MASLRAPNVPRSRGRIALGASCALLGGCSSLLGLDDFTDAGSGGGAPATTTTTTTSSSSGSTGTADASASSTSTTSDGGGDAGTAGGAGDGGGTGGTAADGGGGAAAECRDVSDCDPPGPPCVSAICLDGTCGTVVDDPGTTCIDGGNAGLCDATGACVKCLLTVHCPASEEDCQELVCDRGACVQEALEDGVTCNGGVCRSGSCDIVPTCENGDRDSGETDVDCGGITCPGCVDGDTCLAGGDCKSGYCFNQVCARCVMDADCGGSAYCDEDDGTCKPKRPDGNACDDGGECGSGFCPIDDRVCCNAPCNDECEACGDGTCDSATAGTDPETECQPGPCRTGDCGGGAACQVSSVGTTCGGGAATCSGPDQIGADACDDFGNCVDGGSTACAPFGCDVSSATCRTSCVAISECASGFTCGSGQICVGSLCAAPPCVLALRTFGDAADTAPSSVVLEPSSGDLMVAGTFSGVLYSGGPFSAGGTDAFLMRFARASLSATWTRTFGGAGEDGGRDVSLSGDGTQLFASGAMSSAVDFSGDGTPDAFVDQSGQVGGWVTGFRPDGTYQAAVGLGDASAGYSPAPALAPSAGIAVAVGGANAGPNPVCGLSGMPTALQSYLAILGPGGCNSAVELRPDDPNDEGVFDLARASSFYFVSGANQDGSITVGSNTVFGSNLVARFSTNLVGTWARGTTLVAPRVEALSDDRVVVGGWGAGSWLFDVGGGTTSSDTTVGEDAVFGIYDANGVFEGVKELAGPGDQRILALAHHPTNDHHYVAGWFENSIDFGMNVLGTAISLTASNGRDGFVAEYDGTTVVWALRIAGTGDQMVRGLDVAASGRVYAVGTFFQNIAAGGKTGTTAGSQDGFIVEIAGQAE